MAVDPFPLPAQSPNTATTVIQQDTHTTAQTESPAGALIGGLVADLSKPMSAQLWGLIYLAAITIAVLLVYLVVAAVSFGNETANHTIFGPTGVVALVVGAILLRSPLSK